MFNVKKYNFKGGDLLPCPAMSVLPSLKATMNPRFKAPAYIDSRPYLLPASDQGQEPSCAGFTTAAYAEARIWRETGECEQLDGSLCYRHAKQLDGQPRAEGTSLMAAAQAGEELGWFKATGMQAIFTLDELRYALHMYGVVPVGIMLTEEHNHVNTKTGYIADMRNPKSLGGHAVLACYYDKDSFGWGGSWGTGWGDRGFGRMTWAQARKQFMYGLAIEKPGLAWRA